MKIFEIKVGKKMSKCDVGQDKKNQNFAMGAVRDGILIERCHELERLVTLNSLGLISQLERRGIVMENYFRNMNTRVLSEPILLLLLLFLLFLIHQLEKLSIYLMDKEDLSK